MDLIFFDLDGTLLNDASEISSFTKETLSLLREKDIAYTVATGRSMLSAQRVMNGHEFELPHIYNNGVTVWDPQGEHLKLENLLDNNEVFTVIGVALAQGIAPFVNVIDDHRHFLFHAEAQHEVEKELVDNYFSRTGAKLLPLEALPVNSQVTNISMIGPTDTIQGMWLELNSNDSLVAYSGPTLEGNGFRWMDVHHCRASKGEAVSRLTKQLGASNVICFGDSDNDLSMFSLADECYAPENAKAEVKKSASAVIGHNHKDGVAHFLRERFSLL